MASTRFRCVPALGFAQDLTFNFECLLGRNLAGSSGHFAGIHAALLQVGYAQELLPTQACFLDAPYDSFCPKVPLTETKSGNVLQIHLGRRV